MPPAPTHAQPPPSSTPPINVGHLLQWMNLHRHTTTQSPQLTLGFALGVVHSVTSDRCVMTRIHTPSIVQSGFTALNILCAPPLHPTLRPVFGTLFLWIINDCSGFYIVYTFYPFIQVGLGFFFFQTVDKNSKYFNRLGEKNSFLVLLKYMN